MRAHPVVLGLALLLFWSCQQGDGTAEGEEYGTEDTTATAPAEEPAPAPDTPEGKIASAESAGPPAIASAATIMDWPAGEGAQMTELRAGTNGWTCMPDVPSTPGPDPMCLDAQWMKWAAAWQGHTTPEVDGLGLAYMLSGGADASNTDPYATEPTEGNEWVHSGPHVMVITPDAAMLAAVTADPNNGGPWVMWAGTPYAHIMMPVEEAAH